MTNLAEELVMTQFMLGKVMIPPGVARVTTEFTVVPETTAFTVAQEPTRFTVAPETTAYMVVRALTS